MMGVAALNKCDLREECFPCASDAEVDFQLWKRAGDFGEILKRQDRLH